MWWAYEPSYARLCQPVRAPAQLKQGQAEIWNQCVGGKWVWKDASRIMSFWPNRRRIWGVENRKTPTTLGTYATLTWQDFCSSTISYTNKREMFVSLSPTTLLPAFFSFPPFFFLLPNSSSPYFYARLCLFWCLWPTTEFSSSCLYKHGCGFIYWPQAAHQSYTTRENDSSCPRHHQLGWYFSSTRTEEESSSPGYSVRDSSFGQRVFLYCFDKWPKAS